MPYIEKNELLNGIYSDNPKDVMLYIARFPTADVVERKKGKWMLQTYRMNGGDHDEIAFYICSECGHANWIKEDNYCRNCGAEMRGSDNDR